MKTSRVAFIFLVVVCVFSLSSGRDYFQDIPGYKTLIGDFHTHTVFSDGLVWPTVRVDEAYREGIDVLVISDHVESTPWKNDVKVDHDRSHEVAFELAREKNVLLIKGVEITRDTPPGHYNTIYINDANLLDTPEFIEVMEAASEQNAFVLWNHHEWKGEELGLWTDLQTEMHERNLLHGMEVANGAEDSFSPRAFQWCLDKKLTMFGNSDVHQPWIDYNYTAKKHRTLTLVFAKERTIESVREALFDGRR
jgi:3',5'-nucleoside bisphosphate phosphatase